MNKIFCYILLVSFFSFRAVAQETTYVAVELSPKSLKFVDSEPLFGEFIIDVIVNAADTISITRQEGNPIKYYFQNKDKAGEYRFIFSSPSFNYFYINKSGNEINENTLDLGKIELVPSFTSAKKEFVLLCLEVIDRKREVTNIIQKFLDYGSEPDSDSFNSKIKTIMNLHYKLGESARKIQIDQEMDWDQMEAIRQSISAKKSYYAIFNKRNKQELKSYVTEFESEIRKFDNIIQKIERD